MSKSKQRRSLSNQVQIGYSRMLGPAWIEQTGDPEYPWEVPRISVEISVAEPVAQRLAQREAPDHFYRAFFADVLGRLHAVLGIVVAQRLIILVVPLQDAHGKQWFEESAKHGDFAVKVRCPANGSSTTVYFDNAKGRETDDRYNELFESGLALPVDERAIPAGGLERMAGLIADGMANLHRLDGLRGVRFFLPQVFTP
jgi:hypothetical protein